mmetsp:Transcript_30379/g.68134  ORF Transcript_30379/g.68134 Transcript_30379/m.68134 type:complete len:328 (+) Transcript_30379:2247-3230(+)
MFLVGVGLALIGLVDHLPPPKVPRVHGVLLPLVGVILRVRPRPPHKGVRLGHVLHEVVHARPAPHEGPLPEDPEVVHEPAARSAAAWDPVEPAQRLGEGRLGEVPSVHVVVAIGPSCTGAGRRGRVGRTRGRRISWVLNGHASLGIDGRLCLKEPVPQGLAAEDGHGKAVGHHAELPPPPRPRALAQVVERVDLRPDVPLVPEVEGPHVVAVLLAAVAEPAVDQHRRVVEPRRTVKVPLRWDRADFAGPRIALDVVLAAAVYGALVQDLPLGRLVGAPLLPTPRAIQVVHPDVVPKESSIDDALLCKGIVAVDSLQRRVRVRELNLS